VLIRRAGLAVGVVLLAVLGSPGVAAGAPSVECLRKDSLTGVCLIAVSTPAEGEESGAGGIMPVRTGESGNAEAAPPDPCTYVTADPQ
jgi:hypothetical protein